LSGYQVKEIYYTLQGEGAHAGRAAVFLRFTGCNLWTGREQDRARGVGGCARWCDTDFVGTDGPGGGGFATSEQLADAVAKTWGAADGGGRRYVVCTGGEPLLQLDERLIDALHARGFEVAIETNGTLAVPQGVDWVTVSPKQGGSLVVDHGNELKLVHPQDQISPDQFEALRFDHFFLQPKDDPAASANLAACLAYCHAHPRWRLSLQMHKLVRIP
jgi:7-carboxy-7-deazaguanine synthase (Cx14CxxC type)